MTCGVSFGSAGAEAEGQFDYFIEVCGSIQDYDVIAMADVMEKLQQTWRFDSILFPATRRGRMLAPRLAMRLNAGLAADVTAIRRKNGAVEIVRPAFGGKLMAAIVSRTDPLMMSIRQNVFLYEKKEQKATIKTKYLPKEAMKSGIRLLEVHEKEAVRDIRDSEILVSGGGGVMQNFERLHVLAKELNAQVSASRKPVDNGIVLRDIQVGQSGKTVSPGLYLALGISGSAQHIEGMKNAENIIAVNTNKNAPICSISDIVVEGGAEEFIGRLVDKIRQEKSLP